MEFSLIYDVIISYALVSTQELTIISCRIITKAEKCGRLETEQQRHFHDHILENIRRVSSALSLENLRMDTVHLKRKRLAF